MASWGYLEPDEENELHKSRLLNVEEKPFKRVTKRLNTLHTLVVARSRQAPTPPPETNGSANEHDEQSPTASDDKLPTDLAQLKEDITLDFAAFDSSIARLQFLLSANERERDRFAAERQRIINTSETVRNTTAELRLQLEQARATLEQRKKFDELADKITSNPSLRPRAEQASNLRKLEEEITELEAESKTYAYTWEERREQFTKIMDENMRLRRLIRDEKEEMERREGMDDEGEGQTPRPGLASGNATPRPENGLIAKSGAESGEAVGTPRPLSTAGGRTPVRESPAPGQDSQSFLKPQPSGAGSFSQVGSREPSVDHGERNDGEGGGEGAEDDVEMGETKEEDEGVVEEEEDADSPLSDLPDEPPMILIDGRDADDTMDTT
ncbi:Tho complex subunit 7-domain-containing protein [Echria macrotheca]|uniref:Tho complex subunit 7-domain-containing protein n=1 Tax=Echria macrotheca TaxID=438768 RepID=A0AAJ0BDA0_9PEZI|nr:Tho complex subunit 7-domain-containing protein [Echria macrotheca]